MAKILLTFTVTDPNNVGPWPPSVNDSSWVTNMQTLIAATQIDGNGTLMFNNEEELRNFVNTNRLTDPTVIADIAAWKAAHNMTYLYEYYTVTDLAIDGLEPLSPA
jgi:hypothetical protein